MKLKVTYLLLDFDGVLSLYLGQLNKKSPNYDEQLKKIKEKHRSAFQSFAQAICDVVEKQIESSCADADLVILAVGSGRQTRQHDHYASHINHNNGLCFPLFAELAERRQWRFNRLLVPDCLNHPYTFEHLGKTMGPLEKSTDGTYIFKRDDFSDNLFWPENSRLLREGKKELFAVHLAYLRQYYPSSEYDVTLEFWDDELRHIQTCKAYTQKYMDSLPATIITRHFNWSDIIKNFDSRNQCFERSLQENIHSERQAPLQQTPRLNLLSFWAKQAVKIEKESDIPYSWIALGVSAFLFACLFIKTSDSKASGFKLKSSY